MSVAGHRLDRRQILQALGLVPLVGGVGEQPARLFGWARPRPARPSHNPFVDDGRPVLVVVQGRHLRAMLAAGLAALPGFETFVRSRHRIVLKPNATAGEPYPVTTDPALLYELVRIVRRLSRAGVTIYDSPSFAGPAAPMVFRQLGYFDLRRAGEVEVLSADPTRGTRFLQVTRPEWRRHPFILSAAVVQDADFVINLAVPKRHHAADFSCALKNNFGCTYDTFREVAHRWLGSGDTGTGSFDESVAEFADAVRPDLTIVDARSLLARAGPAFQMGRSVIDSSVNRLVLSGDMVAVDAHCAALMEQRDETFSAARRVAAQLDYAVRLRLGTRDLHAMKLVELTV
jgi:uncharacterized protein (DUF362 family)